MKEIKIKYLIIGAGISGLTFANFKKNKYLIIEKEKEIGGLCRTIYQDGFVWDYAGHFFHFKTDEMKNFFLHKMEQEKIIIQTKNTKIYYKGQMVDYPFQMNIHQLEKEEFIECLYDLFNKQEKEEYDSFLDMLYGKFGESIVDKFLKPYNEKLYACNLNLLDKEAMGRFFPYADINQIINNMKKSLNQSYNNTFLYPKDGAMSFLNKIYEGLQKDKIKLDTEVINIDYKNKKVLTSKKEIIEYEYLINTIPLNQFLTLTKNEDDINLVKKLSYNKVLVFNLGFEKKSDYKEHWIYFPDKDINFYRIGFYDNILNSDRLSMYIEIGYNKDDININIEEQLQKTMKNLEKVGIIKNNKLISYCSLLIDPAYVHVKTETLEDVIIWEGKRKNINVYSIGRYGGWTYCSMEDAMIAAKRLAENI